MEKLFHLKENGTNVKTEVMAGITTFLAMAYILAVNPSMLGDAGMNSQGVFMATAPCGGGGHHRDGPSGQLSHRLASAWA